MKKGIMIALMALLISGCASAQKHRDAVRGENTDRISVGTVQKEIRVGMSGADVVSVLGSPNMVTTDAERRETWVYDKIATEKVYSTSSANAGGGGGLGTTGGSGSGVGVLGLIFGSSSSSGAASTSQRTLTIIIKFDGQGLVRDFSYRQSSF